MSERKENLSVFDALMTIKDTQNQLLSRVLGLDMCVKGMALLYILDGGDYDEKKRKADVLKSTLLSLQQSLIDQDFMKEIDKESFFSSSKGISIAIDTVIEQLNVLVEKKNEHKS